MHTAQSRVCDLQHGYCCYAHYHGKKPFLIIFCLPHNAIDGDPVYRKYRIETELEYEFYCISDDYTVSLLGFIKKNMDPKLKETINANCLASLMQN